MGKFLLGVACTIAVQLLGWNTIATAVTHANDAARSAYAALETQTAHVRGGK